MKKTEETFIKDGITYFYPEYAKKVREAIDRSITKWYGITYQNTRDHGAKDCALCDIFHHPLLSYACIGCPVRQYIGEVGCGSTYRGWHKSATTGKVHNEESFLFAKKMLDMLKDVKVFFESELIMQEEEQEEEIEEDISISNDEFDEILSNIIENDTSVGELLAIPGVYEVLSEHFHNEVLSIWESRVRDTKLKKS